MTRASGIVGAFVVALALAPIRAEAQQISACVNNSSGTIHIVAQNAACNNNEMLLTWSSGPSGGILAGAQYQCVNSLQVGGGSSITFQPDFFSGVSFGSAISTTGTTFTSFVLQPGIYQIHLSGVAFTFQPPPAPAFIFIIAALNNSTVNPPATWGSTAALVDIAGGDRLVQVAGANTVLNFVNGIGAPIGVGFCTLVITKLQ